MRRLWKTVTDLELQADELRAGSCGVIEIVASRLVDIHLWPWPKQASLLEVWWGENWHHHRAKGDRCLLYYKQPRRLPNFLALTYILSSSGATFRTSRGALAVLDEIAHIKRSDAIVCQVKSSRITERLLRRFGWDRHITGSRSRHYIKRFYGEYAEPALALDFC